MPLTLRFTDAATGRQRLVVLRERLEVGRRPAGAALPLDDPSLADRHAELIVAGEGARVRTIDPEAALFVNGLLCDGARLAAGDVIRFGEVEILVERETGGAEPAAAAVRVPAAPAARGAPPPPRRFAPADTATVAIAILLLIGAGAGLVMRPAGAGGKRRARAVLAVPPPAEEAPLPRTTPAPAPSALPMSVPPVAAPRAPERRDADVLASAVPSVVGITHTTTGGTALGSGFFVSSSGHVLTNYHVLQDARSAQLICKDGSRPWAYAMASDPEKDLALLRVDGGFSSRPLPIGSSSALRPGEKVFAIGFPLSEQFGFTLTQGIVSAVRTEFMGHTAIQHDAAINPGNSGGPLLDSSGRVVGVNTWKIARADRLGFAIPIEEASALLAEIR